MKKKLILFLICLIVYQEKSLNLFKPEHIPRINLDYVDLLDRPNIENHLKKHRYECEANYREAVVE